jgi:hypothetical protein
MLSLKAKAVRSFFVYLWGGHGGFGGWGGGAHFVTVTVRVIVWVTVRTGPATVLVGPRTVTVLVAPATVLVSPGAVVVLPGNVIVLPGNVIVRLTPRSGGLCVLPGIGRTTIRPGVVTVFPGAVTVAPSVVLPGNVTTRVLVLVSQKARCSRSPAPA